MMLICAWPRAGPTGGAGVALPASICNLTDVCTFFGAICSLFFENLYRFCGTGTGVPTVPLLCDGVEVLLPVLTKFLVDRRRPRLRILFVPPEERFSS